MVLGVLVLAKIVLALLVVVCVVAVLAGFYYGVRALYPDPVLEPVDTCPSCWEEPVATAHHTLCHSCATELDPEYMANY